MLAADTPASTEVPLRPSSPENEEEHEEGSLEEVMEAPQGALMCQLVDEVGMFAQPPSNAAKQDVGHVLVRMFKERLARPVLGRITVENLLRSEEGTEDVYHKHYVDSLRKIHEEKERRLLEAGMLERHIMGAQARAVTTENHEYTQLLGDSLSDGFPMDSLQSCLPPVKAHFRCCIDSSLLRHYNLIAPDDFSHSRWPRVNPPARSMVPHHTLPAGKNRNMSSCLPLPTIADTRAPVMMQCCDEECMYADYKYDTVPQSPATQHSIEDKGKKLCRDLSNRSKRQHSLAEKEALNSALLDLRATTDHLKNPRYQPINSKVGSQTSLLRAKNVKNCLVRSESSYKSIDVGESDIQVFLATPSTILFTEEYKVGQVYEMELELKNITSVLRRVRVVPPRTRYFSVSLGQFPGDHGMVAGGMSCKYIIRFSPDSLCDFDDVLTVQTQSVSPLCIQLQARRPPPVLTLSKTLDVGSCLVGGIKIVQFTATNRGGAGRFCVLAPDKWPTVHYRSAVSNGAGDEAGKNGGEEGLQLGGVFEVRPTRFELGQGESVPIEILFSPRSAVNFVEQIMVVCDNCHVVQLAIIGEGVLASVSIENVEGGTAEYRVGEDKDITAQCLVKYSTTSPQESINRILTVRNNVNVEIPFYWIPVKPHIVSMDPFIKSDELMVPKVRVQDLESSFFIEPRGGYLPAGEALDFILTYHPVEIGQHNSCMHLVLRTFYPPECKNISEKVFSSKGDQSTLDVIKSTIPPSNTLNETCEICESTVLELELKGECESAGIYLVPPVLQIYGEIPQQTTIRKSFKMCNQGSSVVIYNWVDEDTPHVIQVVPNYGQIGGHSEQLFELMLSSDVAGNIDQSVQCELSNSTDPLLLRLFANVKGVDLTIVEPDVSFGVVKVNDMKISHLTLVNECRQPVKYSVVIVSACEENNTADFNSLDELTIEPQCDTVAALDVSKLCVVYRPKVARSLRVYLKICIQGGSTKIIAVSGESIRPSVSLLNHRLCIADAFINSPVTHNVILVNKSQLSTTYEWGSIQGSSAYNCHVSIEPRTGTIQASETVNIALTFTGFIEAELSDLCIPCHVEGLEAPVCLYITAHIGGLSVSYSISNNSAGKRLTSGLCMDFGLSVEVGSVVNRYLYIRNNSSIPASYCVKVENLSSGKCSSKQPEENQRASSRRRAILSQTMNLTNPKLKTEEQVCNDVCQEMLSPGWGAAFHVSSPSGLLEPFQEVCVVVTAYSDTWGEYSDRLICKVDTLDEMIIPILMTVFGCPLYFLFANPKGRSNKEAILRFGSHVVDTKTVVKRARIVNPSAVDIRLDWRTFYQCHSTQHLLDIVPVFGTAFPLLDPSGGQVREREGSQGGLEVLPDDRAKLIQVKIRPHAGHETSCPFRISPSQMRIPARGAGCVEVTFDPKFSAARGTEETEAACSEEFIHSGVGYLSLEEKDRSIGTYIRRSHQYEVQPLSVCLNAQVIPIRLEVDYDTDDRGFMCCVAASDLLDPVGQMKSCVIRRSSAELFNRTEAPIQFSINSVQPFSLIEIDRLTELSITDSFQTPSCQRINQTEVITLKARGSITVRVGMTLALELFHALLKHFDDNTTLTDDDHCDYNDGNDADCGDLKISNTDTDFQPDASFGSISKELLIDFSIEKVTSQDGRQTQARLLKVCKHVTIQFANGSSQILPIYATVVLPSLCLSNYNADFGTCYIGQAYTMEVQLYNNSQSDSIWTCCEEPLTYDSDTCSHDVFGMTPVQGRLPACVDHNFQHRTTLCVSFVPRAETCYKTSFLFQGKLGEEPITLNVIGSGCLRECLEAPSEVPEVEL